MEPNLVLAAVSGVLLLFVGANETTHGGLAEGMGFGHHHWTDVDGIHCAGPDSDHWEEHQQHMHGDATAPHDHCGAGHMGTGHGPLGPGAGA